MRMSPKTEAQFAASKEPEDELAGTTEEFEERIGELDEHIEDAKDGLRARSDEADEGDIDLDGLDDEDLDDDDPLAFDDPEEDDLDDEAE
jgi:hypothetical protein